MKIPLSYISSLEVFLIVFLSPAKNSNSKGLSHPTVINVIPFSLFVITKMELRFPDFILLFVTVANTNRIRS